MSLQSLTQGNYFTLIAEKKLEIDKFSLFMYGLIIPLVVLPVTSS